MPKGKKQEVISIIFDHCLQKGNFEFDNTLIKEICNKNNFGNPFDATKFDNSRDLAQKLRDNDYFIIHLGSVDV